MKPLKRIPAVEITVKPDVWELHQAGSFKWTPSERFTDQNIIGMQYLWPCGCGTVGEIRFARPGEAPRSPTYVWDGNREFPTVTPPFTHVVAGEVHWSGILQRGEWVGIGFGDDEQEHEPKKERRKSH